MPETIFEAREEDLAFIDENGVSKKSTYTVLY